MKMLIQTETGLLNVFIEPQFKELCDEPLFTVLASDFKSLEKLELASYTEHKLDPVEKFFPFTAYAYSWHLEHLLTEKKIAEIETLTQDSSPAPVSFCWVGVLADVEDMSVDEVYEDNLGYVHVGYCLADDLEKERYDYVRFESFQAYPLFRLPTDHELKTVWTS